MEYELIELPQLTFAGLAMNVMLADIGGPGRPTHALAAAFAARRSELGSAVLGGETFGLSTDPEPYDQDADPFEYFVGAEAADGSNLPDGIVCRTVPAGMYVKFTFRGTADGAGAVHDYLYRTWLQQQPYELRAPYNIEVYAEGHPGPESPDAVTDLLFPVRPKQGTR